MRRGILRTLSIVVMCVGLCVPAFAERVMGEITSVRNDVVVATFPVPINPRSLMTILAGEGENVAGLAISQKCQGNSPPYTVTGVLYFSTNAVAIKAGKEVYVNSINAGLAPSSNQCAARVFPSNRPPSDQDLKLYYYAAGQTVGYGAFGIGYERSIRLYNGLALEADAGITGLGNIDSQDGSNVNADQLMKTLNARLRIDLARSVAVYTGYRWNQARGDDERWSALVERLEGADYTAQSNNDQGTVLLKGLEYGLTLRPFRRFSMSMGYIPEYRTDFGALGVISEPAYTGELRFGGDRAAVRLRGITTEDYWLADIGVTIR